MIRSNTTYIKVGKYNFTPGYILHSDPNFYGHDLLNTQSGVTFRVYKNDLRFPKYAPPLDVHWVWHVHMLAPVQYRTDCAEVIAARLPNKSQQQGRVLNHALQGQDFYAGKRKLTKLSWQER